MTQLPTPSGHRLPSWSWFSKDGAIQYLPLKFTQIDWATRDFENPFDHLLGGQNEKDDLNRARSSSPDPSNRLLRILRGLARKLHMTQYDLLLYVPFDLDGEFPLDQLQCVVIGRDKVGVSNAGDPKHHVLVIRPTTVVDEDGETRMVYERVGVASLRPEHISDSGEWVEVW
jgi:hypothetical protein